ncbi:MAG: hypothetical protein NZM10_03345 [Fimbriimonadales bacterium]|nr:hypothetical protein [Fimbriimonadales bacterium]
MRRRIAGGLGLLGLMSLAFAIPETVVLMPTANRGTPRSLFVATEQYGQPRSYNQTRTRCLYTQLMLTDRFEVGADCIGFDRSETRQWTFNSRLVLTPETQRTPGVAVGVWGITENASPQYYLVGTRTTSFGRLHLGGFCQANRWGWGTGVQFQLGGVDIGGEYLRLPNGDGYTSIGVGRALSNSVYLYTYYSRNHHTRDADLFGVYLSFTPFRLF